MLIRQLFDTDSSTYTYLLADGGEALIIDPVLEKTEDYLGLLADLDLNLVYAVDTHTHADHITAMGALRDATGCSTLIGEQAQAECVSGNLSAGERLRLGGLSLKALYTPGHTDDSYCFLLEGEQPCVFTGDTLLIRGTGRTDFQNGDAATQYQSLHTQLLSLPGHTRVYPGHDYRGWTVSTIDEERRCNPRLQVADADAYIALMAGLNLPNPRLMDIAVPANQACGQRAALSIGDN